MRLTDAQRAELLAALPKLEAAAKERAFWRRDRELAREYLQEAVLGWGDALRTHVPEQGPLGALAHRRSLGRMSDFDRREGRYVAHADEAFHDVPSVPAASHASSERDALGEDIGARLALVTGRAGSASDPELKPIAQRIVVIIRGMAERDQALLVPLLFEEATREEIARKMGKDVSWCNKMILDALRRLRGHIRRAGLEEAIAEVIQFPRRPKAER